MAITPITIKKSPSRMSREAGFSKLASPLGSTVALAALMVSQYVAAAEWRFTPGLDVQETYTDNVRLAASGFERSDFITDIAPTFNLIGNGPRLKASASYAPHLLNYANGSADTRIVHQLSGTAKTELIENLFFVDGTASVGQQNISAVGPQAVDNTNVTGNRATVRTYSVSPYVRHKFSSTATTEARYTRQYTSANSGGLANNNTDGVALSVNSGPAFRTMGWGLQYNRREINTSGLQNVDATTTTGSLRYMITPQFYLTATGGYEKFSYASPVADPNGRFYTGGFSWKPTERTSISASAGKRFFGNTYSLDSSVRSRYSVLQASYSEDITTTQADFANQVTTNTSDVVNQLFLSSIPDPALRQQAVDRFILSAGLPPSLSQSINYFSNRFLLQKSLRATVAITGAKNTVILGVYNTMREEQTSLGVAGGLPASGTLNGDTRQSGANVTWNWKVTPLTSATLAGTYARTTQIATDVQQNTKLIRASLARRFQPNLNGVVSLRRQMQNSDIAGGDYVENAVSAYISMKF